MLLLRRWVTNRDNLLRSLTAEQIAEGQRRSAAFEATKHAPLLTLLAMEQRYETLLQGSDEILFLQGGCHVFALALHDRFDYVLICVKHVNPASRCVPHVYCKSGGYAVDVMGFTPEKLLLDAKRWNLPPFFAATFKPSELEDHYVCTVPCPGLYADFTFMQRARIRAEQRIDDYIAHYNGTLRTPIGPHPFLRKTTEEEINEIFR
jgi:hypothetical protein